MLSQINWVCTALKQIWFSLQPVFHVSVCYFKQVRFCDVQNQHFCLRRPSNIILFSYLLIFFHIWKLHLSPPRKMSIYVTESNNVLTRSPRAYDYDILSCYVFCTFYCDEFLNCAIRCVGFKYLYFLPLLFGSTRVKSWNRVARRVLRNADVIIR